MKSCIVLNFFVINVFIIAILTDVLLGLLSHDSAAFHSLELIIFFLLLLVTVHRTNTGACTVFNPISTSQLLHCVSHPACDFPQAHFKPSCYSLYRRQLRTIMIISNFHNDFISMRNHLSFPPHCLLSTQHLQFITPSSFFFLLLLIIRGINNIVFVSGFSLLH